MASQELLQTTLHQTPFVTQARDGRAGQALLRQIGTISGQQHRTFQTKRETRQLPRKFITWRLIAENHQRLRLHAFANQGQIGHRNTGPHHRHVDVLIAQQQRSNQQLKLSAVAR